MLNEVELQKINFNLSQPLARSEVEQRAIQQKLEGDFLILKYTLKDNNDDELRIRIIEIGIAEKLLLMFQSLNLNLITRSISFAFENIAIPSSSRIKNLLYSKKPYPGLIRLLYHPDIEIIDNTIITIYQILLVGSKTPPKQGVHPHFEEIQECNGIVKIFALFRQNQSKKSKDRAVLSIGNIFRAREIPDQNMRTEIISYLKICVNDTDVWIKDQAKWRIKDLMLNPVNRAEVEKDG
ncbi:MAG: hypothetical protein EZS28_051112, partial [Streblomastix strix]